MLIIFGGIIIWGKHAAYDSSLTIQIRTTTDRSTDGLVGLGLEASLPRLSFNLRSSAYLLLSRLLKKGKMAQNVAR